MSHIRLQVPEEWLRDDFKATAGFDAKKLLDHIVATLTAIRMAKPDAPAETVPFNNLSNLKHAIEPLHYAHVAGDTTKRFLHVTLHAGNDLAGRTAEVRRGVANTLGDAIDAFVGETLPGLASVTVHVQDIDRDRGYTTTESRRKRREAQI